MKGKTEKFDRCRLCHTVILTYHETCKVSCLPWLLL